MIKQIKIRFRLIFYASAMAIGPAPILGTLRAQTLELSQAVQETLQGSPLLEKSRSQALESQWRKMGAYSLFLPSVSATAVHLPKTKYLLTDFNFSGTQTTSIPQIIPSTTVALNLQLPLFDGMVNMDKLQAARDLEASAQSELEWEKFKVEMEVTLNFYRALAAMELRVVAQQNLKVLEDHLEQVRLFKKSGVATHYDVLRVEVQVSNAKTELLNAEDNIQITRLELANKMGREQETRSLKGPMPLPAESKVTGEISKELSLRADLSSLRQRVHALSGQESADGKYWVPRLSLIGQLQYYNNRSKALDEFSDFRSTYQVGIMLTWNIFDGMSSISQSKVAIEKRYQSEKEIHIKLLKARQDMDLWQRKYKYACRLYSARSEEISKAEESVRLAGEGLKAGSRTNTEFLDAMADLYRARAGVINAQMNALEALVNLQLALGTKIVQL